MISAAFAGWRGADPTCGPSSGRRSASGDLRYRYFLRPVAAGRAADLAAKKARKIGGVFKPQLPGNLIDRAIGKQQQALRLAQLTVEYQPLRRTVGEAATDVGQPRFGQMQLPGVIRYRPVLMVVAVDHLVKALE